MRVVSKGVASLPQMQEQAVDQLANAESDRREEGNEDQGEEHQVREGLVGFCQL